MVQKTPNCGILFHLVDKVGYHGCMLPEGHPGPHQCGHGIIEKGATLFENNPQSNNMGHRKIGTYGDKNNPVAAEVVEDVAPPATPVK